MAIAIRDSEQRSGG